MGPYKNVISDFSKRCHELMEAVEPAAALMERDITMYLTIAAAGLIIPFERLRDNGGMRPYSNYQEDTRARTAVKALLEEPFIGSALVSSETTESWRFLGAIAAHTEDPWQWQEFEHPTGDIRTLKVKSVLSIIRNGIAHSNILLVGPNASSEKATELLFLADEKQQRRHTGKFEVIGVKPKAFRSFLVAWFTFLEPLKLPQGLAAEAEGEFDPVSELAMAP